MRVRRLTRRADIDRVRGRGRTHATRYFVAAAAPGSEGLPRIGVAAGRRVGGAVQRNRAKRLLREGVRPLYPAIQPGWDVLLMARAAILDLKAADITAHLARSLARLQALADEPARETK